MRQRKSELYFEEIGEQFEQWTSDYDSRQRALLVTGLLPEHATTMSCLEVGCGTGRISEAVRPLVKDLTVADISAKLAKETGERLGVKWTVQDACRLTFEDRSFDVIVSSECIEHTPDPLKAITEMARVLKNEGSIIITSPNKLWFPVLWMSVRLKFRNFQGNERWLFPWKAAGVLKKNGIANIKIAGCHLLPWQIPGAKRILPCFDRCGGILYPLMINYGVAGTKTLQ